MSYKQQSSNQQQFQQIPPPQNQQFQQQQFQQMPPPQMQMQAQYAPQQLQQQQQYQMPPQMQQQQLQFQPQMQQMYVQPINFPQNSNVRLISEETEEDKKKPLAAVIVTLCSGGSYDSLYTQVKQEAQEGTRVRVYQCDMNNIQEIVNGLKQGGESEHRTVQLLLNDLKEVQATNIAFNWECCGGCSSQSFPVANQKMQFENIKYLLDKGYFLMFSDFSLKALIQQWNSEYLGPNPFVKVGEISSNFRLKFNPNTLSQCVSSQLQKVGELCEKGECNVHAMGGTIAYSVNWSNTDNTVYETQLLTLVDNVQSGQNAIEYLKVSQDYECKLDNNKGIAGHVLLSYPSGGKILTSMGHWVELMKLDTTAEQLIKVAEKNYGMEYANNMKCQMKGMNQNNLNSYVQMQAAQFVQQSAPQQQQMY